MAAQTRKRGAAVRLRQEEVPETSMDQGPRIRVHHFEHRVSRQPPVKSFWSWIFTLLLLALVGLLLGVMFGGAISA